MKATVTRRGAVLLGKHVACDAFDESKPLRVVTHAHADHLMGLRQSLRACEKVLMTPATKDLIDVLRGPLFLMGGFVETLDYGKTFRCEEEQMTFFRADHILGAAQVLVEDAEGARILYTGDFRIAETPVVTLMCLSWKPPTGVQHVNAILEEMLEVCLFLWLRKG